MLMMQEHLSPRSTFMHHGNQSIYDAGAASLRRSKTCIEVYSSDKLDLEIDPEFSKQITEFAEEKRKFLLSSATDEEAWREAIRLQLEDELDRRVKDALNSPTPSDDDREGAESDNQLDKVEQLNSRLTFGLGDSNQLRSKNSKHWRVVQAERKLRRFMQHGQAPLATETKADYVLNTDLLQYGGHHSPRDSGSGLFGSIPSGIKSHAHYSNVAKKAERNFGSLSTIERFEFFYAFTKNGFIEAQRLGRLPDGTELKQNENGKYKDRYGIIRDQHGPFWPSENGPLFAAPTCLRKVIGKSELVLDPENVEKYKQTVDNQPTQYTKKWRGVQIIFDSEKSGRNYEAPPVTDEHSKSLLFESRFESGNLRQARRIGEFEYELVLKTDLYTQRHTQWYYFQVKNPIPGVTYKFKIVNLLKKSSLYNYGMRPLLYSQHNARTKNIGWMRAGHHISYFKNEHNLQCPLLLRDRTHYILEWQMEFTNEDDTYYLAHCYPYTFTDLKDDLETLANDPERSKVMKQEVMCETRAGNSCFLLTVTNFDDKECSNKKGVVVTARVHPGETNSSWMMKGVLEFITGKTPCAKELRNRFIFKIVPMLNPDGVIVGNYRCSLAGRDLNRNYRHPRKENFPTIWHTKDMMEQLSQWNEVLIYCDLHGHSRKQNVFMYGCNQGGGKQQFFAAGAPFTPTENFLKERLFPWLMAQKAPDKFSFRGCRFAVRKCKEATGRVVMFKQLDINNSFTMEATFCGTNICRGDRRHFNANDFEQMGRTFCEVVLDYNNTQSSKEKQNEMVLDMTRAVAQQVLESRGVLPTSLPDFTTEKGRELLQDYCQGRKGLSASEQYAFAFMSLVKKERENIMKSVSTKPSAENTASLSGDSLQKLLGMMCGENSDYLEVLDTLSVNDEDMESESSSDSDSESEPEMIYQETKTRRKKKKHKKNKGSKSDQSKESRKKQKDERPSSTSALPSINSKSDSGRKRSEQSTPAGKREQSKDFAKTFPGFVNKYIGRSNGGIPCFSEERLLARATKRMDDMKRRMEEEQMIRNNILYYSNTDDGTVNVGDLQRRVSYPNTANPKSLTNTDLRTQLQQALERGFNVRTGYMHASTSSSTACYDHPIDDGSDSDSDDELSELRDLRHPVPALISPYGNLSPNSHHTGHQDHSVNPVYSYQNSTRHNLHQQINVAPQKISSCSIPLRHSTQGMSVTPRAVLTGEKLSTSPTSLENMSNSNKKLQNNIGLPKDQLAQSNNSTVVNTKSLSLAPTIIISNKQTKHQLSTLTPVPPTPGTSKQSATYNSISKAAKINGGVNVTPAMTKQTTMTTLQSQYSDALYKHLKPSHMRSMTAAQINGHAPTNFMSRRKQSERHATCE